MICSKDGGQKSAKSTVRTVQYCTVLYSTVQYTSNRGLFFWKKNISPNIKSSDSETHHVCGNSYGCDVYQFLALELFWPLRGTGMSFLSALWPNFSVENVFFRVLVECFGMHISIFWAWYCLESIHLFTYNAFRALIVLRGRVNIFSWLCQNRPRTPF